MPLKYIEAIGKTMIIKLQMQWTVICPVVVHSLYNESEDSNYSNMNSIFTEVMLNTDNIPGSKLTKPFN